ncbi:MAG: hypothetical protein ACLVG5_00755 [Clostridium sp.]
MECSFRTGQRYGRAVHAFELAKHCGKTDGYYCKYNEGCGSSVMENKAEWHHKVPTPEEVEQIMKDLMRERRHCHEQDSKQTAIGEVLMKHAETDKDIVVLQRFQRKCFLTPFANAYPSSREMGIADRIWSAFLPVLQNAARKHLRHLRRASFLTKL